MAKYVKPCDGLVNSLFSNARKHPVLPNVIRAHTGVDYTSAPDNTIRAAAAGKVIIARHSEPDGYGKMVAIEHDFKTGKEVTVYAHLASVSVKYGQKVSQGQKIGVKGDTGLSSGVHLHFEIRKGEYSQKRYVDPLPYIYDKETENIQVMLNKVGYIIRADGYYGENTIGTVAKFQKKHGLTVDGVCGRGTLAILEREAAKVKPVKEKEKEVIVMYEPDSKAMREATENVLKHFESLPKDQNPISDVHRKAFEKGELPLSNAVGLLFTVLDRYMIDKSPKD